MADSIQTQAITVADLRQLEAKGVSREISNGQWVDEKEDDMAAGKRHGKVGAKLIAALVNFLDNHPLGEVYQDNTTYILDGNAEHIRFMRIPDVSFVAKERVVTENPDDYYFLAPDIAIEIISPSERGVDIQNKVDEYLHFGSQQVWTVYPSLKKIVIHTPDGIAKTYTQEQIINGGDVLPGLGLAVKQIFE